MTRWIGPAFLLMVGGCDGSDPDDTGDTGPYVCEPSGEPGSWTLMADGVGSGVLISAWSDGGTVLMVGGEMGGGPGVIARYRNGVVCTEDAVTPRALWWIHGAQPGEWYAVGEVGTIVHSTDGTRVHEDVATEATLFGAYDDGTDVWAVGGNIVSGKGEVWRRRDGTWSLFAGDLPGVLFKVWNGFIVGDHVSYVIDGDDLVFHDPGERLTTVRGRSDTDVYAVGGIGSPRVLHWDGVDWTRFDESGLTQPLSGVWTAPDEQLWVAGNFGEAAFHDGAGWQMAIPPVTVEHFHAVWRHCDETLFAGGNLFSVGNNFGTIARYGPPIDEVTVEPCE
ncbi:MAG: hypothetical protein JRI25_25000 [Deltaproteobacteria bacterium]|nr:hypothetical protein [Deltaproteobacteria bacterium]